MTITSNFVRQIVSKDQFAAKDLNNSLNRRVICVAVEEIGVAVNLKKQNKQILPSIKVY